VLSVNVKNVSPLNVTKSVLGLLRSVSKTYDQLGNVELLYEKLEPLELLLNKEESLVVLLVQDKYQV
jgi:hypothetical protein